jgi:hypothetical protein
MPKLGRRRATFATVLGTGANTLVVSIQAVVLIPLYIHVVGPHVYGAWLSSGDILVWLQALDLGLPNLMIQRIGAAYGRGDDRTVAEYAASGMATLAMVAVVVAFLGCALATLLPHWLHLDGSDARLLTRVFQLGVIGTACVILNNSVVGFSRAIQKTGFMNGVLVISSVVAFVVSLMSILRGAGLWAIAFGIVARAIVSVIGSIIFMARELTPMLRPHFRVRRPLLRELVRISPATAIAGLSYAMMNQSETAVAGIVLGPESAVVLTMTRKAADVARGLLDVLSTSSYGGFAHLVASEDRHRSLIVFDEIAALRWTAAFAMASAYLAVNWSLVTRWLSPAQYGGFALTLAIAVQLLVVGGSYLVNSLYRACGPVLEGSVALIIECVVRVPLMIVMLHVFGLVGLPAAGVLTSLVFYVVIRRRIFRMLSPAAVMPPPANSLVFVVRGGVFAAAALIGATIYRPSWPFVLAVGALSVTVGAVAIAATDRRLYEMIDGVRRALRRQPDEIA